MQAVAFTQTGAPEVLRILEVPDPTPGPGQVRIQVKVSGINFNEPVKG
jgi:NADPH:quinone reductase